MTIDRLEKYRGMLVDSQAIEKQIENLNGLNVKAFNPSGQHSNEPSNPTERTAMKVIELEDKLSFLRLEMIEEMAKINEWLESIEDGELRACVRWYYINGTTWSETSFKVFGYYSNDIARKRVERYFAL